MKISRLSLLQSLCVVGGLLGLSACATTAPLPESYNTTFTPRYSADTTPAESPSGITFALIKADYQAGPAIHSYVSQSQPDGSTSYQVSSEEQPSSKLFRESLGKELEALVIQKGFRISGPFDSFQDMTFPQKKQSDLTLRPVITFGLVVPTLTPVVKSDFGSAMLGGSGSKIVYQSKGSCEISGRIDFEVLESLTGTKMWTKTVQINRIVEDCSSESPAAYKIVYDNAVGKLLEKAYNTTMEKINTYFNKEEMELVKKQSLDVRPK